MTGVSAYHDIGNGLADRLRGNAVRLVVGYLLAPAALGFADRPVHGTGPFVRVQNRLSIDITRRAADGLYQ